MFLRAKRRFKDGKEHRYMDRGIPTEETLAAMRAGATPVRYLVGTPKGRLTRLEQSFVGLPWQTVRESVEVKLLAEDGEFYVLARSRARIAKERGMRRRRLKKLWARLHELRDQTLKRDQLLLKLGAAKKEAGRAWHLVEIGLPGPREPVTAETFTFALRRDRLRPARRREGHYLLRSNLTGEDPATLWGYYMRLTEIEQAFKELKHDLAIRPVFHSATSASRCTSSSPSSPARHTEESGLAAGARTDAARHSGQARDAADGRRPPADHGRTAPRAAAAHRTDPRPATAAPSARPGTAGAAAAPAAGLENRPPSRSPEVARSADLSLPWT